MNLSASGAAAAALALAVLLPSSAHGAPRSENKERLADWNLRIERAVSGLRLGEWETSRVALDELVGEMIQSVNPGKNASKAFGLVLMLRGLAEAGLGKEREASWDWQMAQQLDPELEGSNLSEFGPPAKLLARHNLSLDPLPDYRTDKEIEALGGEGVKLKKPFKLHYVENVRLRRWIGTVEMQTFVGERGLPSHPRITKSAAEIASVLAVAEALRAATFDPAIIQGNPVGTRYELTVNYRLM